VNVGEEIDAFLAGVRVEPRETAPELQRVLDRARTRARLAEIALDRDESEEDRSRAVWAIGVLEDGDGLVQLLPIIRDASEPTSLRRDVIQATAHWENDDAVAVLRDTLATETDEELRCLAAWSLGFREPGAFVDDLVTTLEDRSQPSEVRGHAAEAIGHLYGTPGVFAPREALRAVRSSVLEDDDVLRWDAVFALGVLGGRNDLVLLKRILASELARETPNARIVEETEEMIASMRSRRDSRWPRR
jgi:HEAT repeat protein